MSFFELLCFCNRKKRPNVDPYARQNQALVAMEQFEGAKSMVPFPSVIKSRIAASKKLPSQAKPKDKDNLLDPDPVSSSPSLGANKKKGKKSPKSPKGEDGKHVDVPTSPVGQAASASGKFEEIDLQQQQRSQRGSASGAGDVTTPKGKLEEVDLGAGGERRTVLEQAAGSLRAPVEDFSKPPPQVTFISNESGSAKFGVSVPLEADLESNEAPDEGEGGGMESMALASGNVSGAYLDEEGVGLMINTSISSAAQLGGSLRSPGKTPETPGKAPGSPGKSPTTPTAGKSPTTPKAGKSLASPGAQKSPAAGKAKRRPKSKADAKSMAGRTLKKK